MYSQSAFEGTWMGEVSLAFLILWTWLRVLKTMPQRLGKIFWTRFLRVLGLDFTTSEEGASLSGLNQEEELKHFGVKQKPPPGLKK